MFEGVRTYIDHGGMFWGRSITEMSGWLTGIEFDGENQKLTANRHFTENQAGRDMREMAMSIVDGRSPEDLYGASVSVWVNGDWSGPDDESAKSDEPSIFVVNEIIGVDSVDDVDRPAAGGGWRARVAASEHPFTEIMQHADYDEWLATRPDFIKRLKNDYRKARQTEELKHLQAQLSTVTSERDEARTALEQSKDALHSVRVDSVLAQTQLPAGWKTPLRTQMIAAPRDEWIAIIDAEQAKFATTKSHTASASVVSLGQPALPSDPSAVSDSLLDKATAAMYPNNNQGSTS